MYRKQVRRRRAALVGLVIGSLVLISITFSEADTGPLHPLQRTLAAVMSPLEEGATRALKPARDLLNWFGETFHARGDVAHLRSDNQKLRSELVEARARVARYKMFQPLMRFDRSVAEPTGYRPVTARVIAKSPTVWYATVVIDKGSSSGIGLDDPVVTGDGLVGRIAEVTGSASAKVELITDPDSSVSATVQPDGPQGVVEAEAGNPDDLRLDFVQGNQTLNDGDTVVTAGWTGGRISSAFPPDIAIGQVTETVTPTQEDVQPIHVRPFADIPSLEYVQVLTGGPHRPGVPSGP